MEEKAFKVFLQIGMDVNMKNSDGQTPLHILASHSESYEIPKIEALLERGANPLIADLQGQTPLDVAWSVEEKNEEIINILRKATFQTRIKKYFMPFYFLSYVFKKSKSKLIKTIEDSVSEMKQDIILFFSDALNLKEIETISESERQLSLQEGKDHEKILNIIKEKKQSVSRLTDELMKLGVNLNSKKWGKTALDQAVLNENVKGIKALIFAGANLNLVRRKYVPLHELSSWWDNAGADIIRLFIHKGANVNIQNEEGKTPLHGAIVNRNGMIVELLVEAGANLNIKNDEGESPLDYAKRYKENRDKFYELIASKVEKILDENKGSLQLKPKSPSPPHSHKKTEEKGVGIIECEEAIVKS